MRTSNLVHALLLLCTVPLVACEIEVTESDGDTNGGADTGGKDEGEAGRVTTSGGAAGHSGAAAAASGADSGGTAGNSGAGGDATGAGALTGGNGGEGNETVSGAGVAGSELSAGAGGGAGGEGPTAIPVKTISTVGVGLSGDTFCATGDFAVTIQPRDEEGEIVLREEAAYGCTAAIGGESLECAVKEVACFGGSASSESQTVVLVVLDDSGSMDDNDPDEQRAEACSALIDQLGDGDVVAITDFGHGGTSPALALRTLQGYTDDKDLARAACESIYTGPTGTPIYGSVVDAVEVFLPLAEESYGDVSFSVVMLSDGEPDADVASHEEALEAATEADVPIFTVGLGPAAEGFEGSSTTAIEVLQQLSEETGGAYASSADADGLEGLFEQVGSVVREGRCEVSATLTADSFPVGGAVEGTLELTDSEASSEFSFTVPVSEVEASKCE